MSELPVQSLSLHAEVWHIRPRLGTSSSGLMLGLFLLPCPCSEATGRGPVSWLGTSLPQHVGDSSHVPPACSGLAALALAGDHAPWGGNPPSQSLVPKSLDCLCEGPEDTGSETGLLPCLLLACGGFLECPAMHAPSRSFLAGSCPGGPRPLPSPARAMS